MSEWLLPFVVRNIDALIPGSIGCLLWLQGSGYIPFSRDQKKNSYMLATKGANLRRAGLGLAAIGLVFGLSGAFLRSSASTPAQAATRAASELRGSLPTPIDETTILEQVSSSGESLNMQVRATTYTFDQLRLAASETQQNVTGALCESEYGELIALGVTINYVLYSSDSQVVTEFAVNRTSCEGHRS